MRFEWSYNRNRPQDVPIGCVQVRLFVARDEAWQTCLYQSPWVLDNPIHIQAARRQMMQEFLETAVEFCNTTFLELGILPGWVVPEDDDPDDDNWEEYIEDDFEIEEDDDDEPAPPPPDDPYDPIVGFWRDFANPPYER